MSGGVDSSVAAALLAQKDYDLRAVYMRNWSTVDETGRMHAGSGGAMGCEWQKEWDDVQRVCHHLNNLPVRLMDLSREYWTDVFEPALGQWSEGTTPNPDVTCNRAIKFGSLLDHLLPSSQWLATGHYARIAHRDIAGKRHAFIQRAQDTTKDQSYYLSSVPSHRLAHTIFPLGTLHKSHVRTLAHQYQLPTADKRESMGLCFVGERGSGPRAFARFLDQYVESRPGDLVNPEGLVIGQHSGIHSLTIGQGARIGGCTERYFVARKYPETNTMLVVPGKQDIPTQLFAQVRYRQAAAPCKVYLLPLGRVRIEFTDPMYAVACGQVVAVYDQDVCLGSGTIAHVTTLA
ncbi:tRNA-5-taurinomethyluridine 2-sulfurtransferase [Malassezia psittaci]|uniref:tRNA-5-taurinomethyluridine 2-sulfurtransferase n=1 Tax=Malassezia psittaci TaxID=1821823 RepID=A0AAF0FIP2_9BASI|nr:tRNA-5-taurinomethyluridine 2-sulfurtransferase [Malassezia psittaci]